MIALAWLCLVGVWDPTLDMCYSEGAPSAETAVCSEARTYYGVCR